MSNTDQEMSQASMEMTRALLVAGWDEIEDLPDYGNPPTGSYVFTCTKAEVVDPKATDANPDVSIRVHFSIDSTVELADSAQEPPKSGLLFMLSYKGAKGVQRFKKDFQGVALELNAGGPVELLEKMEGVQFAGTLQFTPSNDDPTRGFTNLRSVGLAIG